MGHIRDACVSFNKPDVMQDINPQLVARLSQRLFFVVNKVDLIHTSEGLEPEEIKEYVADLVTKQLACEGFRLSSDQVNAACMRT